MRRRTWRRGLNWWRSFKCQKCINWLSRQHEPKWRCFNRRREPMHWTVQRELRASFIGAARSNSGFVSSPRCCRLASPAAPAHAVAHSAELVGDVKKR